MSRVYSNLSEESRLKHKRFACKQHKKPVDDTERFWSYVDVKGLFDCWEWQGGLDIGGYGLFFFNGKRIRSHRYSYQLYNGDIPKGMFALHKCNNRKCVNPFHIYQGTCQDNVNDKMKANRQSRGIKHGMSKLTEIQVKEIRENKDNLSQRKLAKIYGITKSTLQSVQKYKTWKAVFA